MPVDRVHVRAVRPPVPDWTVLARATIAILICVLMLIAQTAYVAVHLSSLCFSAAVVALFGLLVTSRAAERRRQDCEALLHVQSARRIVESVAMLKQHRRLLKEFGRLLSEPIG